MEQFSLEKYLENPNRKVITRKMKSVRIVCTDSPIQHHPIVGFVECDLFEWTDDGKVIYGGRCEDKNDLFFADGKEELSEFEKRFIELIRLWRSGNTNPEENLTQLQFDAKELLDLARKELEANYYTKVLDDKMVFKSELHEQNLQAAYDIGKQDALKALPKWKKAEETRCLPDGVVKIDEDGKIIGMDVVWEGEYFITLQSLKSLPKEE